MLTRPVKSKEFVYSNLVTQYATDIILSVPLELTAGTGVDQMIGNRATLLALRVRFYASNRYPDGAAMTSYLYAHAGCRTALVQSLSGSSLSSFNHLYVPTASDVENYQFLHDHTRFAPFVYTALPNQTSRFAMIDDFTIPLGIPYQIDGNSRHLTFYFDFFKNLENVELFYTLSLTFQDN